MAGKYLYEFDEHAHAWKDEEVEAEARAKAALEVWTEQLRQAKAELCRAFAILADAPNPGLAGVGVYTEMHCPKCNRLIYWKVRVIREFFCVGCDEWPTMCLCQWKEPVAHAG